MQQGSQYSDQVTAARKRTTRLVYMILLLMLLFGLMLYAVSVGGLSVSYQRIFSGLFVAYDPEVALIYDLRFPRIVIALLAGAGISTSGVLFQAILKNPISDPAIIGVCSGASFMVLLSSLLLPQLLFYGPLLSFVGGCVSFFDDLYLVLEEGLAADTHHFDRNSYQRLVFRIVSCDY